MKGETTMLSQNVSMIIKIGQKPNEIEVYESDGTTQIPPNNTRAFSNEWLKQDQTETGREAATIIWSGQKSCRWVYCGGKWYWRCK